MFSSLWKIKYEIIRNSRVNGSQFIHENLKILKQDVIKAFKKCKNYDLLKITMNEFRYFYIDKIEQCKTLLDLQIAVVYIYSLPHGMSDIVNAIF